MSCTRSELGSVSLGFGGLDKDRSTANSQPNAIVTLSRKLDRKGTKDELCLGEGRTTIQ